MATFQKRGGKHRAIVRKGSFEGSKTFDRLVDAKAWARAMERQADLAGTGLVVVTVADGTFGKLLDRYQKEMWPIHKWARSKEDELERLRKKFGDTPINVMTKKAFVDYAMELREDLAGPGIATRMSYLKTVLETARDLWETTVPLKEIEEAISALRKQKIIYSGSPRTREPEPEEIDAIIAMSNSSTRTTTDLDAICSILRLLPLRIGELCKIEWTDIVPEKKAVWLRQRKHPDSRIKATNDELVPFVTVDGIDTFDLLMKRPRHFIRPYPYERPIVSSAFWLACKYCRIDDLHLHDLRAGAISLLLGKGVPIPVVASISGHKDWKVLQAHYERIQAKLAHQAVDQAFAMAALHQGVVAAA